MIHLTRNVCDGCRVWCHFDRCNLEDDTERNLDQVDHYADGYTSNPREATCRDCLETAEKYGEMCFARLGVLALESGTVPWE